MTLRLSPPVKGIITAVIMIAASLYIDSIKDSVDPQIQYFIYGLYVAGILWTLIAFRQSSSFTGKFGELFSQGFKCFIIVALLMVIFTGIFVKMHPELAEQEAIATKEYYIKEGNKLPPEIEELAKKAKKQYAITVISISIFRYLIIGAGATAILAAILSRRK